MQYRSRPDIVHDILEQIREPTLPTRVMYGARLSFSQLKEYRTLLLNNDLIQITDEETWAITVKGSEYLGIIKEAANMLRRKVPV